MPRGNYNVQRKRRKTRLVLELPFPALSTNKLYAGTKRRSYHYKTFRKKILCYLNDNYSKDNLKLSGNLKLAMEVGFSSSLSDLSNSLKGIEDVVVEWAACFDDRQIVYIELNKYLVNKGSEFMKMTISKVRRNVDLRTKQKKS